ncbi:hypothetical protein PG993_008014 [Apiospora rasikravindrae]|uniref:Uncharacterized protein n=1 Tax=Apiospora rasikravindrae TaxID=990691 RepID=A0ABR1T1F5_9PEZI
MSPAKKKTTLTPEEASAIKQDLKDRESMMKTVKSKLVDHEKSLAEATSELDRLGHQIMLLKEQYKVQKKKVAQEEGKVTKGKEGVALLEQWIDVTKGILKAPVAATPELKPTVSENEADDDNDQQLFVSSKHVSRHPLGHFSGASTRAPPITDSPEAIERTLKAMGLH